jgi:magnesium transporter
MRREIISGLMLGSILGIIGFLRVMVWSQIFPDVYGIHFLAIGLTVGIALVGVVIWGTLCGSMLPIILKKLGADPAVSSAPFVATLVDVTGLLIYFSVAYMFLQGTLLK